MSGTIEKLEQEAAATAYLSEWVWKRNHRGEPMFRQLLSNAAV
jgi:hypothetical protein